MIRHLLFVPIALASWWTGTMVHTVPVDSKPCALAIGDSLTVGASSMLGYYNVRADGVVGRQWMDGAAQARFLRHQHLLPHKVIIELGTNGPVYPSEFDAMVHDVGPRRIIFVTPFGPRSWIPSTARTIVRMARRGHFGLVRWDLIAPLRPDYTGPDGIHLTERGYRFYGYLLAHGAGCAR